MVIIKNNSRRKSIIVTLVRSVLPFALLLFGDKLKADDYYWIGGNGNWSDLTHWATTSGGLILHTTIPSSSDDIYFDANSGAGSIVLSINVNTVFARDLKFIAGCPSVSFSQNTYDFDLFGSLQLQPNVMLFLGEVTWNFSGVTSHSIRTNGVPMPRVRLKGSGNYSLLDSLKCHDFSLESGSFQSNGYKIVCNSFGARDIANSGTKNFTSSIIHILGWPGFGLDGGGNFQFNGTHIIMQGTHCRFVVNTNDSVRLQKVTVLGTSFNELHSSGLTRIRKLFVQGASQFVNLSKIDTLTYGPSTYIALNESANPLEINVFQSPSGLCDGGIHFQGRQPTMCGLKLSNSINLNNASFRNIQVTGGISLNAINGKDYGNNSGIIFINSISNTYYWVNGSGSWSDASHWSMSSGGSPSNCTPGANDNVVFDQNSGLGITNIDLPKMARVHHLTSITNFPINFNGPGYFIVGGSLRGNSYARFKGSLGIMHFSTSMSAQDSISLKTELEGSMYVLGRGNIQFGDSTRIQGEFRVLGGVSNLSNRYISIGHFSDQWAPYGYYSVDSAFINMQNAHIRVIGGYHIVNHNLFWNELGSVVSIYSDNHWGDLYTVNKDFWEIILHDTKKFNFHGHGFRARKLVINGSADFYQSSVLNIDTLEMGPESQLIFRNPGNVLIDTLITKTSCTAFASIISTTDTTLFTLKSGPIQTEYLSLQNIQKNSGNSTWTSLTSNDLGGNSNINFTQGTPRTLYWVGGSGDWADSTHWSLTSGGPGGECLPTPVDSVLFNSAGFSSQSDTVYIGSRSFSKDLVVTYTGELRFDFNNQGVLNPYGSVTFQRATYPISSSHNSTIEFSGGDSTYFKTNNALIHVNLVLRKGGSLTLMDSLKCTYGDRGLDIYNGGFYGNQNVFFVDHLFLVPDAPTDSAFVDLSGSEIEVIGDWECFIARGNLHYRGVNTKIFASSDRARVQIRDSVQIRHVMYTNTSNSPHTVLTSSNGGRINFLELNGNLNFNGPTLVDTLILEPDYAYLFDPSQIHLITDSLRARGDFCHYISIKSQIPSQQASLRTNSLVSGDFLEIRDMNYLGTNVFYTGLKSTNQGNNTNFLWANQPGYIYGFPDDTTHLFCQGTSGLDSLELRTDNFNDAVGFIWSTGDTASSLWVKQSGIYWVGADYVTCMVYDTIVVHLNYLVPIATAQTAVCKGSIVALSANGGNNVFRYIWSTGDTVSTTSVVVNHDTTLGVSIYRGGFLFCTDSISLYASSIDSLSVMAINPFCHGDSTGQINLQQVHGGFGSYQYSWSHSPTLQGSIASNLPNGCYIVTITDSLGCSLTDTICLTQPQPLSLTLNISNPVCKYDFGSVVANPAGGSGAYQINYVNFNPQSVSSGTYTIEVLDSNGCYIDTTFIIEPNHLFEYEVDIDTATCLQYNGSVTIVPINPNSPYQYIWGSRPLYNGSSLNNLAPNVSGYVVVVDTLSNCFDTLNYVIPFGGISNASFGVSQTQGMTPLIVQTSNDNPSSQYVNYWIVDGDTISNSIDTTFIFTQYGTYVIKHCLWDPQFECGHCHDVTIIADPNPALEVPNVFTPNGDGMNDFFIPAEIRDLDLIEIQVHSRNGPLIWQSSDYPFRWDGMTQNGTPCPDGVYFWTLRYREALSSNYIFLNGTVTLVR
jgi:gliding motility-associated-like protein